MSSSTSSSDQGRGPLTLLLRVLGFSVLLLLAGLVVALFGPHIASNDYLASIGIKQARLRALASPKVVVIGGSNVAFGMNSELLEEAMCKPVVNMGIHADLGFRFMAEEVADELGPGDVLVVALEYTLYARPERTDDILYLLLDRYPKAIAYVPFFQRPKIILATLVMRLRTWWKQVNGTAFVPPFNPTYRAAGFNERGDMVAHLALERPDTLAPELGSPIQLVVDDAFHTYAERLVRQARTVGARVLFTWPSRVPTAGDQELAEAIEHDLRDHGLEVFGRPADYFFPDPLRFDTRYHLHGTGRSMRTQQMIADLCGAYPELCCAK